MLAHAREALAEAAGAGIADDLAPEMQPAIIAVAGGLQDHQVLAEFRQQRGGEFLVADDPAVLTMKREAVQNPRDLRGVAAGRDILGVDLVVHIRPGSSGENLAPTD